MKQEELQRPASQPAPPRRTREMPRGMIVGFPSLDHPATPMVMRGCLREQYVERLTPAGLFKGAGRLADDLKRRGFSQEAAFEMILSLTSTAIPTLKRAQIKQIEKAVGWVYHQQEHGLTCTGVLVHEGLCFVRDRACQFHDEDNLLRQGQRNRHPAQLPPNWSEFMAGAHPADAYYAAWTYPELAKIESEKNLNPGDRTTPIFIGFRGLADRVRAAHRAAGYNKDIAMRMMHLLRDVGLVEKVIQGKSGTRRPKANGYIRIIPIPAPPLGSREGIA